MSLAPGPASPCLHHPSLGGLSPWRLETVCRPWLCVRRGLCKGLGVGCQWSRWSRSPRKWGGGEGRGGRVLPCPGGRPQGATATGILGQGAHAHVGREGTSRKSLSLTDEMALIPGGEKGPASSPFSQLRCRWPPLAPCDGCTGASRKGDHPFLFPWKLVRSTSAPARPGGSPRRRPAG